MTPGRPDATVVRRHLLALDQALQALRRHSDCSVDDLAGDRDPRWMIERGLQLCAQNALDVATHVAAGIGLDVPDCASAIDHLADAGILPRSFAERFRGVAGFGVVPDASAFPPGRRPLVPDRACFSAGPTGVSSPCPCPRPSPSNAASLCA